MVDVNPYTPPATEVAAPAGGARVLLRIGGCMVVVILITCFLLVAFFCLVDLGMTWLDPKGGASGNLPPVLSTEERISRSYTPAGILLVQFIVAVLIAGYAARRLLRNSGSRVKL